MIYTYYNFEIYHYIEDDVFHLSMHDWMYEFNTLNEAKEFVKKHK